MRLPTTLLSYACGLLAAPYLQPPYRLPLLALGAAGLWLICQAHPSESFARLRLTICTLFLFFFCTGLIQYVDNISPPDNQGDIHHLSEQGPIILEGTVESMNMRFPQGASCIIAVTSSFRDDFKKEQSGTLQLKIDQLDSQISPGDRVRFRTKLRTPRTLGAPGEFNYPRHLAHKNIFTTGYIHRSSDMARLDIDSALSPSSALRRWRQHVGKIIDNSVPPHMSAFLHGLATGDRGALSPEQRTQLSHSGIAHLFAISGMHIGIIVSFIYILILSVYRRVPFLLHNSPPRRFLPLLILPLVAAYMIFTGEAISTLRAFLGLTAITVAFILRRQVAPLQLLAAAALMILLLDPLAIFTPAFQLSFAGAAGILCITPRWTTVCQNLPKIIVYPATLFVVTLAATIATLPLVLLHFHILAPAGLILNMIAVPAVTLLAVPLCLFGVIISGISPETASLAFNLVARLLDLILNISNFILTLPGLSGRYLYLSEVALTGVGLLALALLAPVPLRFRTVGIFGVIVLLNIPQSFTVKQDQLNIIAISVGQGDATLVRTSSGKTILVDGGGFSRSNYDTGERLVAPTLGYFGIEEIDAVVLTHNHPDHRNGLLHILKNYSVHSFWSPVKINQLPTEFQTTLTHQQIPVRAFAENWSYVEQTESSTIAAYRVPDRPSGENNRSLVLYFQQHNEGALLTGDLELAGVEKLAQSSPPGPVTLLKIPHHGSRNSNPQPLIDLYNPEVAYISVGYNNRYGQPHPAVLSQLATHRLKLERSDLSGSLFFSTSGDSWKIKRWEKGLFR